MKSANDTMKNAEAQHERNIERFNKKSESANKSMDDLGKLELEILNSFDEFSNTIEKIQNRPQFKEYNKDVIMIEADNSMITIERSNLSMIRWAYVEQ